MGVLTALFVVVYFASFAGVDARDRITTVQGGSGRTDIWKVGWRMVEDKPVLGVGSGNFHVSSIHYLLVKPGAIERDEFIIDTPEGRAQLVPAGPRRARDRGPRAVPVDHRLRDLVRAEGGAAGSGARATRRWRSVARGMVVALVGILAADFFITEQYGKQLWLLLGLGPALLRRRAPHLSRAAEPEPGSRKRKPRAVPARC